MPAFSWDFLSSISGYLAAGVLLRALAILALGRALSATGTRIRFWGEVTFGLAALFLLPEAIRMLDPDLPVGIGRLNYRELALAVAFSGCSPVLLAIGGCLSAWADGERNETRRARSIRAFRDRMLMRNVPQAVADAIWLSIVAVFYSTLAFWKLTGGNYGGFAGSIYASWIASVVFFVVAGLAISLATLEDPSQLSFAARVKNLVRGVKDDAMLDYLCRAIGPNGLYYTHIRKTISVLEFDDRNGRLDARCDQTTEYDLKNIMSDRRESTIIKFKVTTDATGRKGQLMEIAVHDKPVDIGPPEVAAGGSHERPCRIFVEKDRVTPVRMRYLSWIDTTAEHSLQPTRYAQCVEFAIRLVDVPGALLSVKAKVARNTGTDGPEKIEEVDVEYRNDGFRFSVENVDPNSEVRYSIRLARLPA